MWFLDKKIKQHLKQLDLMRRYLFRLSQRYLQNDAAFQITDQLFNEFNQLSAQTMHDINAFEKVTATAKDTLISFLPWSEAYALRCTLDQSLDRYANFCEKAKATSQFLQEATKSPPHYRSQINSPQYGSQIALPKCGSHITQQTTVAYSHAEIGESNHQKPLMQHDSARAKLPSPHFIYRQQQNANVQTKICSSKNSENVVGKNVSSNYPEKLPRKNNKKNCGAKPAAANAKPVSTEKVETQAEKKSPLLNQWHSFWQTVFPPSEKKAYKPINEWLGLPLQRQRF